MKIFLLLKGILDRCHVFDPVISVEIKDNAILLSRSSDDKENKIETWSLQIFLIIWL